MAIAIKVSQSNSRPGCNAVMSNGRTLLPSAATPFYWRTFYHKRKAVSIQNCEKIFHGRRRY